MTAVIMSQTEKSFKKERPLAFPTVVTTRSNIIPNVTGGMKAAREPGDAYASGKPTAHSHRPRHEREANNDVCVAFQNIPDGAHLLRRWLTSRGAGFRRKPPSWLTHSESSASHVFEAVAVRSNAGWRRNSVGSLHLLARTRGTPLPPAPPGR